MSQPIEHTAQSKTSAAWAILPLGLATALSLMGDATLYAVLPTHPADAGIALGAVGVILSVNRLIRLISNGPAGWLVDRLPNRRWLFLGSLALGVLSTVIYAISSGLPLLFTARLLWGLAWSGIWIGGNAIVLQMAPESQRGHWVGIYQVWFFFGAATGAFLGGALTDVVGYHKALWIGAGISALVIGALGMGMLPAPNSIALFLGTFASAIASGGIQSLTTALVGDVSAAKRQGKNLGIFYTASDLGSAIGPLVAYALLPITGLLTVYLGCAILMLGVAVWAIRFATTFTA
jgi:MFS family permease